MQGHTSHQWQQSQQKILHSFVHECCVLALCLFWCYFHGQQAQELSSIMLEPLRVNRLTRSSCTSHKHSAAIPNSCTVSYPSTFISRTSVLWNNLPSFVFPPTYKLPAFKRWLNFLDFTSLCFSLSSSSYGTHIMGNITSSGTKYREKKPASMDFLLLLSSGYHLFVWSFNLFLDLLDKLHTTW